LKGGVLKVFPFLIRSGAKSIPLLDKEGLGAVDEAHSDF